MFQPHAPGSFGLTITLSATRSDPYVIFTLDGVKVHKSEVQKKTISPVWEEEFIVNIVRRPSPLLCRCLQTY